MQVKNMISESSGNAVKNQFILTNKGTTFFQSYDTIIVKRTKKHTYLDRGKWDYSVTTGRYRNQFLGESVAETRKKIEAGEYKLANLNK